MGVVQGWGLQMTRLAAWQRGAAFKVRTGMVMAPNQTLPQWRHQMGSKATRWSQVEREAEELIAVWTMCRLMETALMYDLVEEVAS